MRHSETTAERIKPPGGEGFERDSKEFFGPMGESTDDCDPAQLQVDTGLGGCGRGSREMYAGREALREMYAERFPRSTT